MSIVKVAKLAGVSISSVSRVMNNHPRVAPETAQAVRAAMAKLGYTPSPRRPGPKPGSRTRARTMTIAFLVVGASSRYATPGFQDLLRGVSQAAAEHHAHLYYTYMENPEEMPKQLAQVEAEGLLLHGALPRPGLREHFMKYPTVWLMGNRRRPEWGDQVMPDVNEIGELAANYLCDRGHGRLAYLNLDQEHRPFQLSRLIFEHMARQRGADVVAVEQKAGPVMTSWHPYAVESVAALADAYVKLDPRPTGIFVADDMQVALLQPALLARGVELGAGKTEIISCNNEKPFLMGLDPRPAVVDIRLESIGRHGVAQLLWRMKHPEVKERILCTVEPQVVTGENDAAGGHSLPRA